MSQRPSQYGNICAEKRPGEAATSRGLDDTLSGGVDVAHRTCTVKGCDQAHLARGWCSLHYQRWKRDRIRLATCGSAGCTEPPQHRDFCYEHYVLWSLYGDTQSRYGCVDLDRFWAKVDKTDACWLWTGGHNGLGYGRFQLGRRGRLVYAHRYSYELAKGAIPDDLVIDHLCRTSACVNPDHLEPVTIRENHMRGVHPWVLMSRSKS